MIRPEPPNPSPDAEADHRMVRDSLDGDRRARRRLARRLECVPRIVWALNRKLGQPLLDDEISDLSQDIVLSVWRRRDTFEGRARLETWVYRFCYLEFMNRRRKSTRRRTLPIDEAGELGASPITEGSEYLDLEALEQGLQELGPPEEDIVRLKHYEELTFREIGERLNMPGSSVKTCYYRGIEWLRTRLAPRSDWISP
ncbi:MAG: sigma-70 family RNA polymerase sigma factor [Planctomycetes bacterium]|nr:sigma-70 family RNA polymerase sigma factor [Planctomycetota bacterium]